MASAGKHLCLVAVNVNRHYREGYELFRMCQRGDSDKRTSYCVSTSRLYTWQVVGTDLFELKGEQYLIVVTIFQDTLKLLN